MIDARDYPSHEELERAMRLEYYISELKSIDAHLASLECAFNFWKYRYEVQVQTLRTKKEALIAKIDALENNDILNQSKKGKK